MDNEERDELLKSLKRLTAQDKIERFFIKGCCLVLTILGLILGIHFIDKNNLTCFMDMDRKTNKFIGTSAWKSSCRAPTPYKRKPLLKKSKRNKR